MAVKTKSEILEQVKAIIGEDTSDANLALIEDITDTLDDFETKANGGGEDWKKKYEDNDKMWREKYRDRFFSGGVSKNSKEDEDNDGDNDGDGDNKEPELKTDFDELFK